MNNFCLKVLNESASSVLLKGKLLLLLLSLFAYSYSISPSSFILLAPFYNTLPHTLSAINIPMITHYSVNWT